MAAKTCIEQSSQAMFSVTMIRLALDESFAASAEKYPRVKIAHQLIRQGLIHLGALDVFNAELDPEESEEVAQAIKERGCVPATV